MLSKIESLSLEKVNAAEAYCASLAKPKGSLGRLEEIACRLAGMASPLVVSPALVFVVAGDHGIAAQGVSPFPQSITREMVENFLVRGAAINALAESVGMDLSIVDAGCVGGAFPDGAIINCRLGEGTADFSQGPAMSEELCERGLRNGMELAFAAVEKGYRCLAIGEMGISNTSSATALYAAMLDLPAKELVGPGTGADAAMIARKLVCIERGLECNRSLLTSPHSILAALGGFEIVTMAGIVLGSALKKVPVLIDGFIASSAYLAAVRLAPKAADYCFLSHLSAEPGHRIALERLAQACPHPEWVKPLLSLGMRLGEGTGAAMVYPLLKGAVAFYTKMASLGQVHRS